VDSFTLVNDMGSWESQMTLQTDSSLLVSSTHSSESQFLVEQTISMNSKSSVGLFIDSPLLQARMDVLWHRRLTICLAANFRLKV
jgi:hypothetical protein